MTEEQLSFLHGDAPLRARVYGEAFTHLPHDLYIPPDALEVCLDAFEGPLDLLLYLIRKQNIDILDIPVADITRQYMGYVELMQAVRLELAAEYLLMAAMLAEIKSRMLLPRAVSLNDDSEEDPRAELVRRLQEYELFRQAAEELDDLPRLGRDFWTPHLPSEGIQARVIPPPAELKELLLAMASVLRRAELFGSHHISREPLSIRERMSEVLEQVQGGAFVAFVSLFRVEEGRLGVVVTFMAILELVKESLLDIVQNEPLAPLHVRLRGVEPSAEWEPTLP